MCWDSEESFSLFFFFSSEIKDKFNFNSCQNTTFMMEGEDSRFRHFLCSSLEAICLYNSCFPGVFKEFVI